MGILTRLFEAPLALPPSSAFAAGAAAAQPEKHTLLGVDCAAPLLWHCPDHNCEDAVITQAGATVELKTRRPFFLDCPSDYKPGDKVNVLLEPARASARSPTGNATLPGDGLQGQVHHLVIITPST